MINGKKVLSYILARSGSKSIKDKNIIDVCGKPLVAYTIQAAKESKYIDRIVVSTDSPKYAEIVEQYGAEAPFLRPKELSGDLAKEMDACIHLMDWVEKNSEEKYDIIVRLEITSPLRLAEDIDKAIEKLEETNADTVITVTEAITPPFWMNTLDEKHSMKGFIRPGIDKKNRQELPTYYQLDGLVFVGKWDFIKKHQTWFADNSFATITPRERSLDVDESIQLELLRTIIKKRDGKEEKADGELSINITKLFSLKDKVAIITGAVGLIGSQHAEILSDAGAHVVIADIEQKKCDEFAQKITQRNNVEALGIKVDVSNEDSVREMLEKVKNKFGRVDILVNNAVARPSSIFKKFEEYSLDDWEEIMKVNLNGVFLCSKLIGNEMVKQGKGVIVNIGSIYGIVGTDPSIYGRSGINAPAVYSASKGGIINLTRYLATYWASKKIRVNCLSPGGVENNQDPKFIKNYCKKTPLGRMAKKDDFKGALLFLVSDASSYMTGANLVVDGGWTAW